MKIEEAKNKEKGKTKTKFLLNNKMSLTRLGCHPDIGEKYTQKDPSLKM